MKLVLCTIIAYLLGSVCASIPLSKRCMGEDIRQKGSGNAGATNAARVFGLKAGLVTLALDMAKTVAAMLIGKVLAGVTGEALSGAMCIIGHCFPLYFGFRGGKGVSGRGGARAHDGASRVRRHHRRFCIDCGLKPQGLARLNTGGCLASDSLGRVRRRACVCCHECVLGGARHCHAQGEYKTAHKRHGGRF